MFRVHKEDPTKATWWDVPNNGRLLRNLGLSSNFVMSHILHFYHLVALDYVDVNNTGVIPKGFLCPNYNAGYYKRGVDPINANAGGGAVYTVNDPTGTLGGTVYLGDLTHYLAGQYVRALKVRRMCHQLGALFTGKMPIAATYTPGCVTTKVYDPTASSGNDYEVRKKYEELLFGGPSWTPGDTTPHPLGATEPAGAPNPGGTDITPHNPHPESILGFIGRPTDFWAWANNGYNPADLPPWAQAGVPGATPAFVGPGGIQWKAYTGTMLFDVVAAAHLFPEYFWIGTGHNRFLAWGSLEGAGKAADGMPLADTTDERLMSRNRTHVLPASVGSVPGWPWIFFHNADHRRVREYVDNSWYTEVGTAGRGRHPWRGKTRPDPSKGGAYTFAKAPRYINLESGGGAETTAHANAASLPYEVGPLARMMANAADIVPIALGLGWTGPGTNLPTAVTLAVEAGERMCYYPGIVQDVDNTLGALGFANCPIGVAPKYGDGLAALPPNVLYAPAGFLPVGGAYALPANAAYTGDGVLDRIAARALETLYIARHLAKWFYLLDPAQPANRTRKFKHGVGQRKNKTAPRYRKGVGLTEAPRGALAHWCVIGKRTVDRRRYNGRIMNYQIITPTAWNVSPLDVPGTYSNPTLGQHGPIEESIMNTPIKDVTEPIEILRVIHSFDPCIACTVHVSDPKKGVVGKAIVESSA